MPAGVSKRAPARGSTSCAQDGSARTEARLEVTQLAVHIAQEALGVLIAAAGPVDASAEPTFDIPTSIDAEAGWMALRPDIRLFEATERAADRVWKDSSKDWFPPASRRSIRRRSSPRASSVLAEAGGLSSPSRSRCSTPDFGGDKSGFASLH